MDVRALLSRLTSRNPGASRVSPLVLLLAIGGGIATLLLVSAARFGRVERVPLEEGQQFKSAEFNAAQSIWRKLGLSDARFVGGVIQVPADRVAEYRQAWAPAESADQRTRWADAWQQANERLGQFSGSRERDAAKEISRAQVVSRLLEESPDIETADIVWDESAGAGWREPQRARATVYLRAAEGRVIGPDVVDAVRRAVSGSKAHLAPEDVTVMDQTRMITYDGQDASSVDVRTAQLVAEFRSRLATALQHIPGTQVEVHANAVDGGAVPVAVTVSVPEQSLLALAKLDSISAAELAPQYNQKRREVFRRVEQHIRQSVASKVAQLIPAGLVVATPEHLVVETLPGAPTPVEKTGTALQSAFAAWWREYGLMMLAAGCGLGSVSMFIPRRREPNSQRAGNTSPAPAEALEVAGTVAESPAAARASQAESPSPQTSPAMQAAAPVAEATPAVQRSQARSDVAPAAQEPAPSRPDLLQDVLTRLERQRNSRPDSSTRDSLTAVESAESAPARQLLSARRIHGGLTAVQIVDPDLEQLPAEDPALLQEIVRRVEVDVWSRALFAASPTVRQRILPCLTRDDAQRLARELESNRPVRLRDIDAAQREVLSVWKQLRQNSPVDGDAPVPIAFRPSAA